MELCSLGRGRQKCGGLWTVLYCRKIRSVAFTKEEILFPSPTGDTSSDLHCDEVGRKRNKNTDAELVMGNNFLRHHKNCGAECMFCGAGAASQML